jgi:phenylpyruvate tautomerase PptA (4-oxalocrotonate tautomerase family)
VPFIQVDIRAGIDPRSKVQLAERIVDVVHEAIGSARAHINVAIREIDTTGLVESGEVHAPPDRRAPSATDEQVRALGGRRARSG